MRSNDLRPFGRKPLLTNFIGAGRFADGLDDLAGLRGARNVERHNEPVSVEHRPILPHYDRTIVDLQPLAGFMATVGVSMTSRRTRATPSLPMPSILAAP